MGAHKEFMLAVYNTAFNELKDYLDVYDRNEDFEIAIDMQNPDRIRQIIINACNGLTELGMFVIKNIYQEQYPYLNEYRRFNGMPSNDMHQKFAQSLLSNIGRINLELTNYERQYVQFIERFNKEKKGYRSIGASAIGGVTAGMIFGPVGAIIGGIASSMFSDNQAIEEVTQQAKSLHKAFFNLIESTTALLDEMTHIMRKNIDDYNGIISIE